MTQAFVQKAQGSAGGSNKVSPTLGNPVSAGNTILMAEALLSGTAPGGAPTASGTAVLSAVTAIASGTAGLTGIYVWYATVTTGGTLTLATSATPTAGKAFIIWEMSGIGSFGGTGSVANGTGTSISATVPGVSANGAVFMACFIRSYNDNASSGTATLIANPGSSVSGCGAAAGYILNSPSGNTSASLGLSPSDAWTAIGVYFQDAPITTSSRTVPGSAALALTAARDVPSKALFSALNTYQRTVPSRSYFFFEGPRIVPAKASLLQSAQRIVPNQVHLLSTQNRAVPAQAALTVNAPRSVPAFAALQAVSSRHVPAQGAFYLPVRAVPAYALLTHGPSRVVPAFAHFIQNGDQRFVPARAILAYDAPDAPSRLRHKKSPHGKSLHTPD